MPLENRLKELRAARSLNQQQLGQLVGASRQTISLIERGDYNPPSRWRCASHRCLKRLWKRYFI